ncbi:hypothetical protein MPSEU_001024500 [Mayamaea pseudoterrestris]|nr:hypothetical protein MPSEU_001024500 [Mayamaea pseudoterrestris]
MKLMTKNDQESRVKQAFMKGNNDDLIILMFRVTSGTQLEIFDAVVPDALGMQLLSECHFGVKGKRLSVVAPSRSEELHFTCRIQPRLCNCTFHRLAYLMRFCSLLIDQGMQGDEIAPSRRHAAINESRTNLQDYKK